MAKKFVSTGKGGGQGQPSYASSAKKASAPKGPSWSPGAGRFVIPNSVEQVGVSSGLKPAPAPVVPPALRKPTSGSAARSTGGGGGGNYTAPNTGGGGGMGTGATGTFAAQAAPAMSEDQWLAQDAQFIDEKNAANQDFENLIARLAQQRSEYELDNKNTLRNLGWDAAGNRWNEDDRLTGYGNAFQNQENDFASRGMLDSSLYGTALNDLNRGFNQQRDDLATALQNFLTGQASDRTAAQGSRDQAVAAAQRQALQRFAAQQSLGI